jgi:hypothetical protein
MPTITNIFGLPQPFVDLVSADNYSSGEADITTTSLFQPPKIRELMKRHADTITEDASDRVWTMLGTANHWVLEQVAKRNPERYITEERFYMDVDGVKLGGQIDLYDKQEQVLYDYKVSSVYKALSDDRFDWTAQAAINTLLLEHNGYPVKRAAIILVMKDWKLRDSKIKADYPKCAIVEIKLEPWKPEETFAYIKSRITLHQQAKELPDDQIPVCTEAERWSKPTTYAVLPKKGAKRAVNGGIFESRSEAEELSRRINGIVEERAGSHTRCEDFCRVKQYCSFGRNLKQNGQSC